MGVSTHHVTDLLDVLYRDKKPTCCVAKLLDALADNFHKIPSKVSEAEFSVQNERNQYPYHESNLVEEYAYGDAILPEILLMVCSFPQFRETPHILDLSVLPGSLVKFRCKVRSIVRTRMPAFSASGDALLLFRPESSFQVDKNSQEVDVVSLGCVIGGKTLTTPVVVKIFEKGRELREGDHMEVTGIVSYKPEFQDLIHEIRGLSVAAFKEKMLRHDEANPNPKGVRRVHAIKYEASASGMSSDMGDFEVIGDVNDGPLPRPGPCSLQ